MKNEKKVGIEKTKNLNIRLPFDLWRFLRHKSTEKETSMNNLIISYLEKDKNKLEKRLTGE
jgi:predicted HicB family RNase H-like nuclease